MGSKETSAPTERPSRTKRRNKKGNTPSCGGGRNPEEGRQTREERNWTATTLYPTKQKGERQKQKANKGMRLKNEKERRMQKGKKHRGEQPKLTKKRKHLDRSVKNCYTFRDQSYLGGGVITEESVQREYRSGNDISVKKNPMEEEKKINKQGKRVHLFEKKLKLNP